jgi:hypothetical protein
VTPEPPPATATELTWRELQRLPETERLRALAELSWDDLAVYFGDALAREDAVLLGSLLRAHAAGIADDPSAYEMVLSPLLEGDSLASVLQQPRVAEALLGQPQALAALSADGKFIEAWLRVPEGLSRMAAAGHALVNPGLVLSFGADIEVRELLSTQAGVVPWLIARHGSAAMTPSAVAGLSLLLEHAAVRSEILGDAGARAALEDLAGREPAVLFRLEREQVTELFPSRPDLEKVHAGWMKRFAAAEIRRPERFADATVREAILRSREDVGFASDKPLAVLVMSPADYNGALLRHMLESTAQLASAYKVMYFEASLDESALATFVAGADREGRRVALGIVAGHASAEGIVLGHTGTSGAWLGTDDAALLRSVNAAAIFEEGAPFVLLGCELGKGTAGVGRSGFANVVAEALPSLTVIAPMNYFTHWTLDADGVVRGGADIFGTDTTYVIQARR